MRNWAATEIAVQLGSDEGVGPEHNGVVLTSVVRAGWFDFDFL